MCYSLVGLQAGGYSHPWTSAYVLCTLLIGLLLMVAFVVWEWKFAPYPMVPVSIEILRLSASANDLSMKCFQVKPSWEQHTVSPLWQVSRSLHPAILMKLTDTGMNFFALLNFFPILFSAVFDPDPVQIGLKGIPPAFSTTFGAVFTNAALTWFKGWNRELLLCAVIIMSEYDDQS